MSIEAKPVVKNKYWIVEDSGRKIATVQAAPDGVVLVQGESRSKYPSIKLLGTTHNIRFVPKRKTHNKLENTVYDYPCGVQPYNSVYDVRCRLPLYTTSKKSKSYYCAGYYLINTGSQWIVDFCPKKIILMRHEYLGPFYSDDQARSKLTEIMSLSTHK